MLPFDLVDLLNESSNFWPRRSLEVTNAVDRKVSVQRRFPGGVVEAGGSLRMCASTAEENAMGLRVFLRLPPSRSDWRRLKESSRS